MDKQPSLPASLKTFISDLCGFDRCICQHGLRYPHAEEFCPHVATKLCVYVKQHNNAPDKRNLKNS